MTDLHLRLQHILQASKLALREPWPLGIGLVTLLIVLLTVIIAPNRALLGTLLMLDEFGFFGTLQATVSLLGFFFSNHTFLSQALIVLLALLTALNMALFTSYLRHRIRENQAGGIGFIGTLVGLLGIGCASCGSIILATFIGVSASAGFLGILPLQGAEFGLLGGALLLISISLLADKILNPAVCRVILKEIGKG